MMMKAVVVVGVVTLMLTMPVRAYWKSRGGNAFLRRRYARVQDAAESATCEDLNESCPQWGREGYCTTDYDDYMITKCKRTCNINNCAASFDECKELSNPCENGGVCTDLLNDFSCTCEAGYTGKTCSAAIDESAGDSSCVDLNANCAAWELKGHCAGDLHGEYMVLNCRKSCNIDNCAAAIDDCTHPSNPCQNGGECKDLLNDFVCSCPQGYTDKTCSTVLDGTPQSATCQDLDDGESCADWKAEGHCAGHYAEYMNIHCTMTCNTNGCADIDECNNPTNPCENGGECTDLDHRQVGDFSCSCSPGYTDNTCSTEINECQSNPCQNWGICTDLVNDFTCACPPGYTAKTCSEIADVDDCNNPTNPCENGGVCKDLVNDFACLCPPGYTGKSCSTLTDIDYCNNPTNPCHNGGFCTDLANGFTCACQPGYTDATCSTDIAQVDECNNPTDPCKNGGVCTDLYGDFSCSCKPGYTDKTCSTDLPDIDNCNNPTNPCQNGGVCKDLVHAFSCLCLPGYTDHICSTELPDIDDCNNPANPCKNGAVCTDLEYDFSCTCQPGYTDKTCSTDLPDVDDCNNPTNPCENGGICKDLVHDFSCFCPRGFKGNTCSIALPDVDDCNNPTNPCENGGICKDLVHDFSCLCPPGFTDSTCSTELSEIDNCNNPTNPCQNGGICTNTVNDFSCSCSPGYTDNTCSTSTETVTPVVPGITQTWRSRCVDDKDECAAWKHKGNCNNDYRSYMQRHCRKSCRFCSARNAARHSWSVRSGYGHH